MGSHSFALPAAASPCLPGTHLSNEGWVRKVIFKLLPTKHVQFPPFGVQLLRGTDPLKTVELKHVSHFFTELQYSMVTASRNPLPSWGY